MANENPHVEKATRGSKHPFAPRLFPERAHSQVGYERATAHLLLKWSFINL